VMGGLAELSRRFVRRLVCRRRRIIRAFWASAFKEVDRLHFGLAHSSSCALCAVAIQTRTTDMNKRKLFDLVAGCSAVPSCRTAATARLLDCAAELHRLVCTRCVLAWCCSRRGWPHLLRPSRVCRRWRVHHSLAHFEHRHVTLAHSVCWLGPHRHAVPSS